MNGLGGQPVLILPEGTLRTTGKDAQNKNISAARAIADAVRTTLGPKGMDKMLVDSIGDVTITNDGATILDEMEIEHPAAKMMVEIAKTQEDEVGDGTTTAVVIAGELLKNAEDLIEKGIHPTIIAKGYRMAKAKVLDVLNEVAEEVDFNNDELLKKIALTAMTGKGAESAKESLAEIAVNAVKKVAEEKDNKISVDKDSIKIESKQGGSLDDTELIDGVVIDKEIVHPGMPKIVKDAKIALLDTALEIKETETNAEIRITSPNQLKEFIDQENAMIKEMIEKVVASGCNVVFCQKGIDDLAQHYLAKKGIVAVRRVKKSDMELLSKSTGARIVSSINELSPEDLGTADIVEERKIAGEEMVFVRGCKDPKAVSILVRGGTEHVVEEAKRAMEDAVLGVAAVLETKRFVYGGGAVEVEVAKKLREYAETFSGREQLAINAFADAIEIVPKALAESTGADAIDILVELRAKHEKGEVYAGVDVFKSSVGNMKELGVIEPMKIKQQAVNSATEAAEMILRIDDVITSKGIESKPGGGGETPEVPEED